MRFHQQILCWTALTLSSNVCADNMNGAPGQYKVTNSANAYSTDYSAEYFEVYSQKIKTLYSEVHWKGHDPIPLPEEIVRRFSNKAMAIVGYEVDQVMKNPTGDDVSVPITWAYNHHYCAWLMNAKRSKLVKKKVPNEMKLMGLNHGSDEMWTVEFLDDAEKEFSGIPLAHFFSEGNGGEMRMSYHGYPKGYAQVIDSPDIFRISPMQIDTWNRKMKDSVYMPGPLPSSSQIPQDAGYNGLLECPCSDRLPKEWSMTYALKNTGKCTGEPIQNATECFSGARMVIQAAQYIDKTVVDGIMPTGCSASLHADGSTEVIWNTASSDPEALSLAEDDTSLVAVALGQVNMTVRLEKAESQDAVEISIVGPADKWFGVGFGSYSMCIKKDDEECPQGGPYAIIINGEEVTERKLGYHGPGSVLADSVTVKSNIVSNGNRTVVLTRSLKGASNNHYSFDPSLASMPVIMARGCDLHFGQHCGHGSSELNFLPIDKPTEICQAGIEGTIGGNKFNNQRCADFPTSDLVNQNNPTCSVQTYRGGLNCCRDGQSLLDKEQENPWPGQYLEYYLKFRFYFEEFKPVPPNSVEAPSHHNLIRLYWTTEAFAGEYDIVPCREGVPPSQCVHVITGRWKVSEMLHDCSIADASGCTGIGSKDPSKTEGVKLIYAGPHCHAPSCLSMDLINADTGRLICHVEPLHGESDELYDEHGFIAIPPCLWGDKADGLLEPELLSLNTTLLSIKRNNNTWPHTGDMASWQMRGIVVPKTQESDEASSSRRFVDPNEVPSRPLLRHSADESTHD
jgi:hypothetical protein